MKISKRQAMRILREQAERAEAGDVSTSGAEKVEQLSQLCEQGVSKTHIAFLGTAMLAKSVNARADLYAIKPTHDRQNPNAFSARSLCHGTLVPLAAELGFSLGVTGREPLNNQPYFRMTRLDDGTPVHVGGKEAFDYMLSLIKELQKADEAQAGEALRAFIAIRREYQPRYVDHEGGRSLTPEALTRAIAQLVRENSEGGKRAQAAAAGLVDVFAGPERVESGRINDPSRHYPGDVAVRAERDQDAWEKASEVRDKPVSRSELKIFGKKCADTGVRARSDQDAWEKAIEVRDKPVSDSDVQIFGKKCADTGVREAALLMVSERQARLDDAALADWARDYGIGLTLFYGWEEFTEQVLYWSELPKPLGASRACAFIHDRLVGVEASPEAVALWQTLITENP